MNYFKDSYEEMKKVTWPSRHYALKITAIAIVFTLVMTAIISGLDFGFKKGYDKLTDLSPKAQRGAQTEQAPINIDPGMIKATDKDGNPVNVPITTVPVKN